MYISKLTTVAVPKEKKNKEMILQNHENQQPKTQTARSKPKDRLSSSQNGIWGWMLLPSLIFSWFPLQSWRLFQVFANETQCCLNLEFHELPWVPFTCKLTYFRPDPLLSTFTRWSKLHWVYCIVPNNSIIWRIQIHFLILWF